MALPSRQESDDEVCWRDTECTGPLSPAFSSRDQKYIISPESRTVSPIKILTQDGVYLTDFANETTILNNNQSLLVYDFEKEIGGIITVVSFPRSSS
jgi:hypothetical protein